MPMTSCGPGRVSTGSAPSWAFSALRGSPSWPFWNSVVCLPSWKGRGSPSCPPPERTPSSWALAASRQQPWRLVRAIRASDGGNPGRAGPWATPLGKASSPGGGKEVEGEASAEAMGAASKSPLPGSLRFGLPRQLVWKPLGAPDARRGCSVPRASSTVVQACTCIVACGSNKSEQYARVCVTLGLSRHSFGAAARRAPGPRPRPSARAVSEAVRLAERSVASQRAVVAAKCRAVLGDALLARPRRLHGAASARFGRDV